MCMSFQREFLSNFCAQNLQSHYLFSLLHLSFITVAMIGHSEIQPTKFKSLFELKSSTSVWTQRYDKNLSNFVFSVRSVSYYIWYLVFSARIYVPNARCNIKLRSASSWHDEETSSFISPGITGLKICHLSYSNHSLVVCSTALKSIERETAYHGQCWSIFSQVSSIEKTRKLNNFNLKQAWTNLGCASMKKTRPALLTVEKCELLIESRYHWLMGFHLICWFLWV